MTVQTISKELKELAPKLNGQDRMQLGVNTNRSYPTITRYLKGQVADPLAGEKILEEAKAIVASKLQA